MAGCIHPSLAPAAEPGASPAIVRACDWALECLPAENRLYDQRLTIKDEERTKAELAALVDARIAAVDEVADLAPHNLEDARALGRIVYRLAAGLGGWIDHEQLCDQEGIKAARVVEYLAGVPV